MLPPSAVSVLRHCGPQALPWWGRAGHPVHLQMQPIPLPLTQAGAASPGASGHERRWSPWPIPEVVWATLIFIPVGTGTTVSPILLRVHHAVLSMPGCMPPRACPAGFSRAAPCPPDLGKGSAALADPPLSRIP